MRPIELLCAVSVVSCVSQESPSLQVASPIDVQLDTRVRELLDQFNIPGAAVCVLDDGKLIHEGFYGVADADTGEAVTGRTRFQIASVSKVLSAWAVMALVESGKLDLHHPIEDYTGDFRLPPSDFDSRGVTAARLLAHTAGTSAWGFLGDPWTDAPLLSTRDYLEHGGEGGEPLVVLEAAPGSRHRYSGGGFTLLQLAVEQASGMGFSDFVANAVYEPLAMDGAGFNGRRGLADYAVGHDVLGRPLPDDRFPALAAAGAYASLDDLKCFVRAHWDTDRAPRGGGALRPATFDLMFGVAPESDGAWTLGYEVIPFGKEEVELLFGHTGDNPGYHSLVWVHPTDRDALIILTNGEAGNVFRNQLLHDWCELTGHDRFTERPVPVGISLLGTLARNGVKAAVREYRRREEEEPGSFAFGPRQLDRLAYSLESSGRLTDSTTILEFNLMEFPESPLALDSMASRYIQLERFEEAEPLCRRLLELDPALANPQRWLQEIEVRGSR
ncbi:MAG: serine hydrolase domain-containing protein [Planctomycetota bacterium]